MGDAREGLVVSCVDAAETYKSHASISVPQGLVMPMSLKLMPLYVLACLRTVRNFTRLKPGIIFVHFSGYLKRAKVRYFELGNFQTELDQLLR